MADWWDNQRVAQLADGRAGNLVDSKAVQSVLNLVAYLAACSAEQRAALKAECSAVH